MTDRLKVIPEIENIVKKITPETLCAAINALAGHHRTSQAIARSGLTVRQIVLLSDEEIYSASRSGRGTTWDENSDGWRLGIGSRMIDQINEAVSSAIIPALTTAKFLRKRK